MGRLVEHDRAALGLQHAQMLHAFGVLARQEPLITEPVGRQAGERERVEHGARSGRARDRQPTLDGPAHDRQSGIVDGRHARVGYHQHGGAGLHTVEQPVGLGSLVVVVIGDDRAVHVHAESVREVIQSPRVLGRDDVGVRQQRLQPVGGVAHIADRRGGEHNGAARHHDRPRGGLRLGGFRYSGVRRGALRHDLRIILHSIHGSQYPARQVPDDHPLRS